MRMLRRQKEPRAKGNRMKCATGLMLTMVVLVGVGPGCASSRYQHILEAGPEQASWQTLPVSAETAFEMVMATCTDLGFEVVATDEANRTARFWGGGSKRSQVHYHVNAAVFVRPVDERTCRVGVVTQGERGDPAEGGWTEGVLAALQSSAATSRPAPGASGERPSGG